MEEEKKAPFPGTFFQKFEIFLSVLFWVISLSNTVQKDHQLATTSKLAKWKIKLVWKESKKYKTMIALKSNWYYRVLCASRTTVLRHAERETYHYTNGSHTGNGVEQSHVITHGKQTTPSGQGQGDMLFNPIITASVKTSHLPRSFAME